MFETQNKIIIVDDNQDHLNILGKEFYNNGIGCKTYLYNSHYSTPLKGVRIAFFDVNINPSGGGSQSQKFNSLAVAIEQYISLENGPFALIFWTQNQEDIEDFKRHVQERHSNCPKPFLTTFIDKDKFINKNLSLANKLKALLNDQTIRLLFDFEEKTSKAAKKTIDQIYKIIPKNDNWGHNENFKENFEKIFSKIACSTLGINHAKEEPDKAVYEALIQILNYQVINSQHTSNWGNLLASLKNANKINEITNPEGFQESQLNTIFHVEANNLKSDKRGVVLKMKKNNKIMLETFNQTYHNWASKLINFKTTLSSEKALIVNKLISNSNLIAIEISSACDYQQNKQRLNKYLFGVLIEKITDENLLIKNKSDFSMNAGVFFVMGKEYEIWVNLNYVFGAQPYDVRLGKALFLLKKEIMDMIGNRYANHVSRIGITSF